jgi:hypothetical protein
VHKEQYSSCSWPMDSRDNLKFPEGSRFGFVCYDNTSHDSVSTELPSVRNAVPKLFEEKCPTCALVT